ncbi:carboxymuconolactone decarboxylase family protein [Pantoea latae]|uniref:4-carboxymuconolactone decarboxylase n=1 Tax=Pantoea latae TaxID=1964541 RepID=A0A1V9DHR6_9GAMM|nr:4-carboxymuconolactone decarboxylase [Pantoea latae]
MLLRHPLFLSSAMLLASCATAPENTWSSQSMSENKPASQAVAQAAPAMAAYSARFIKGDLWNRPALSARDRSLVTLSALISRNDRTELADYLNLALDNGVTPGEIAESLTHLAFYAGWPNATSAAVTTQAVFAARHIDFSRLPGADVAPLPLDEEGEAKRAAMVEQNFGHVAPGVVKYTTEALFRDLWLRPGLAPRDRSLITVSALVTAGQVAQVPYHLNRAMDNGLTQEQAAEVLTQLAFIAGWPNIFSALPVFKEVFTSRQPA